MDNRYQYQPWYIKLWRRRWYLWAYWLALIDTLCWLLKGCLPNEWDSGTGEKSYDSRWFTLKCIWIFAEGRAEMKMEWWYSHEEVFKHDN